MSLQSVNGRMCGRPTGVLLIQVPGKADGRLSQIAGGLERQGHIVRCVQPSGGCWRGWYADAERGLSALRTECGAVIAGGLGIGASLALLLAAEHPEDVQGTALFAPMLWLDGWLAPWAAGLACTLMGRRMAEIIATSPCPSRKSETSRNLLEQRRLLQAARNTLGRISQPALIIHSREDRCAGLDNAGYLQRHLKGLVEMAVLGGRHQPGSLDRQQGFIVEKAQSFIEGIAARRPQRAAAPRPQLVGASATAPQAA